MTHFQQQAFDLVRQKLDKDSRFYAQDLAELRRHTELRTDAECQETIDRLSVKVSQAEISTMYSVQSTHGSAFSCHKRGFVTIESALEWAEKLPDGQYAVKTHIGNADKSVYLFMRRNGRTAERPDVYGRYLGIMPNGYEHPELLREEYWG